MNYPPLPKEEVVKAIEGGRPARVPLVRTRWWGEGLWEQYGRRLDELNRYGEDAEFAMVWLWDYQKMGLSWMANGQQAGRAHDAGGIIPDWDCLDEFIDKLPRPDAPGLFDDLKPVAERAHKDNVYLMFGWWHLFFEKPWVLRGMENLMMDYYLYPENIHRLHGALCENYVGLIERARRELAPDGFWTSDDLGNQRQLMMSPQHFRELIKPYYARVGAACRKAKMHFWLHSCGNNTEIMDDLIETGVNVFHPVQKHTMDERETARRFGGRMTFLAGFDVQHTLQEASPDQVRREVRELIDTFDRPEGGMCLAAGNGIVAGTPFENIEAFLDEAVKYGTQHRSLMKATPQ